MYSKFLVSLPLLVMTAPSMTLVNLWSSNGRLASDWRTSKMCGSSKSPKKSVASLGNCVGMLSMEQTKIPGPLKLYNIKCFIKVFLKKKEKQQPFRVLVLLGVVEAEWSINCCALVHKLDRSAGIGA